MIKEFLEEYYHDKIKKILDKIQDLAIENKSTAMLAHTHGQPASPTTLGKEFLVFFSRLENQFNKLKKIKLKGKLNGATGNYNALAISQPSVNWIDFSKQFITKLGLEINLITTQVEPKDTWVELFQNIKRINNIILDLNRDVWMYIAFDYFKLKKKQGEVGSSTMPHKVNPIDFENSEGNINVANSLFTGFENLQLSRMQRDLSDSTVLRNIGVAFGHSVLAYNSTLRGLNKLMPNETVIEKDLKKHPEVLTEAVQTILRFKGKKGGYEVLKDLSRGKIITLGDIRDFIDTLDIDSGIKDKLKKLNPEDYVGLAEEYFGKDKQTTLEEE
jgi:adenylosuccinate lyase